MTSSLRNQTAIVGIGETAYTKRGGTTRTEMELVCEAIRKAVEDAGLSLRDVDGLSAYNTDRCTIVEVAQMLNLKLDFGNLYPGGGNATAGVVDTAGMAIATGKARVVVCYRAICQGQHPRYGQARSGYGAHSGTLSDRVSGPQAFMAPFGLMVASGIFAMDARRHMHAYGTTSRQMGLVAVNSNRNAQRNPRAVMYGKPLTIEQHQTSRMIADPYRLYDCCLESDGACAIVVTSSDRARDLRQRPAFVAAVAQGLMRGDGMYRTALPDELMITAGMSDIARRLYDAAGISPADIDVAQFYETFTGQVIMALEDFGFCERGEGGPFVESGGISWDGGSIPINTSGGNLAEGYIHGLSLVIEGVRQIRGTSTSQVADARHCLVAAAPAAPPSSAMILSKGE